MRCNNQCRTVNESFHNIQWRSGVPSPRWKVQLNKESSFGSLSIPQSLVATLKDLCKWTFQNIVKFDWHLFQKCFKLQTPTTSPLPTWMQRKSGEKIIKNLGKTWNNIEGLFNFQLTPRFPVSGEKLLGAWGGLRRSNSEPTQWRYDGQLWLL